MSEMVDEVYLRRPDRSLCAGQSLTDPRQQPCRIDTIISTFFYFLKIVFLR